MQLILLETIKLNTNSFKHKYQTIAFEQNKDEKINGFGFSKQEFLKAVDESLERIRRILLLLQFASMLVLMALINSLGPKYNWFKAKIAIERTRGRYLLFPLKESRYFL